MAKQVLTKLYPKSWEKPLIGFNALTIKPEYVYVEGTVPLTQKYLAVIGSRKATSYGKEVCEQLISGLRGFSVTIVSGLAIGIDGHAHSVAIKNKIKTIAIPGSGLAKNVIYPSRHLNLANEILKEGGALISEYEPSMPAAPWTFPRRNRLIAAISDAVLVIEAAEKSGTLITATLANELGKIVMCVPGSITSSNSFGVNSLLKDGASLIVEPADIINNLGLTQIDKNVSNDIHLNKSEMDIIKALSTDKTVDELAKELNINISKLNISLSILLLKKIINISNGRISLSPQFAKRLKL